MRKLIFFSLLLVCTLLSFSQDIIKNSEKPLNTESGRIVKLEEVLRIKDDGEEVVFRNPRDFSQLNDGSLICFDYPVLYKFNNKGKFIFKFYEQGEGPRQCVQASKYYIDDEHINVYSWAPPKVLKYDLNGNYKSEIRIPVRLFEYLHYFNGEIFGIKKEINYSDYANREAIIFIPWILYKISPNFKKMDEILEIPVEHYIKNARSQRRTGYAFIPYKQYLFSLHTAEYQVEKIDLHTGKIDRTFKRPYKRIKSQEKVTVQKDPYNPVPRNYRPPSANYKWDIYRIQVFKNTLWVFTSTMKDNMRLIDVYDMEGNYIDYFYLQFPENNHYQGISSTLITDEGFLFTQDSHIDTGIKSIGKYKIVDN